jgi:hypothetical protein
VRTSQREIRKGVRDLDRELLALKREEQKLIAEIKAAAKANNQPAARVLAKSLVRLRAQMSKLQGSQANLRGVSTNLTTAAASTTVAQSMGTATAAMSKMQQQMNPAKVMVEARCCLWLPSSCCSLYTCNSRVPSPHQTHVCSSVAACRRISCLATHTTTDQPDDAAVFKGECAHGDGAGDDGRHPGQRAG